MSLKLDFIFKAETCSNIDIAIIAKLDQEYFPTPWQIADWNDLFSHNQRAIIIAREADQLVGFALFDISVVDSFAHLLKIIVVPSCRKQGKAQDILKFSLLSLETEWGIKKYFLEVEITNKNAVKLYEKLGFKIIHTKRDFYGMGRDAFIMTI